jgi:hypothetical protein
VRSLFDNIIVSRLRLLGLISIRLPCVRLRGPLSGCIIMDVGWFIVMRERGGCAGMEGFGMGIGGDG